MKTVYKGGRKVYPYRSVVDADYIIYAAGMAGQYSMKDVYMPSDLEFPVVCLRYVKDLKAWLLGKNLTKDDVVIIERPVLEPVNVVLHSVKMMLKELSGTFEGGIELYLTGGGNFREDVAVEVPYKFKRLSKSARDSLRDQGRWVDLLNDTEDTFKEPQRPKHKEAIIKSMRDNWGATLIEGKEADDEVSRIQYADYVSGGVEDKPRICITHVDKDIDMIPGPHYNPRKEEMSFISKETAYKNFFKQLITGDATDSIIGLKGYGPVRANKIIDPLGSADECIDVVYELYQDFYQDSVEDTDALLEERAQLLWMMRGEDTKEVLKFLHKEIEF